MASANYGTSTTLDLLASTLQSVAEFGEERTWEGVEALRQAYNRIVDDMLGTLIERTTDRQRVYGGDTSMLPDLVDQMGRADAQKLAAGTTVGFPLTLRQISIQWTRKYFEQVSGKQFTANLDGAMSGFLRAIQYDIKVALFTPTNATFLDKLVDNVSLAVKRLVNADSAEIPPGPNGEAFVGASHTHYLGTASFVAANLDSVIEAVVEHHAAGQAVVNINRAQEAAVRGFTGFTAYLDARLIPSTGAVSASQRLDAQVVLNDRAIGVYSAGGVSAEIRVKPWIPANYVFAYVEGAPVPLVYRERRPGSGDLQLVADNEQYPLRARSWEREYGIGVWTRTNGAVLQTNNATYTVPTLTP